MSGRNSLPLGYEKFRLAIKEGTSDPEVSRLIAYAQYLSNGGTPNGWMQFTETDVVLMQTYYNEQRYKEIEGQAILIANNIAKLFSGDKT